jgi:hypothetical protein
MPYKRFSPISDTFLVTPFGSVFRQIEFFNRHACSQQLSSSSAMNDNWKPYLCKVNGKLASIFVNLGLRDAVPNRVKTLAVVDVGLFSIAASRWPIRQ